MIDRLRALANRPIRPEERIRAFALAGVLVVAALVVLLTLERPPGPAADPAASAPNPALPSEAPPATGDRAPARAELAAARRTVKRFLAGYLAYSYGRGTAADIAGASPQLRRELAAEPPRVPARVARLRPRVLTVQLESEGTANVEATALVEDGRRTYSTVLELDQAGAGWQVGSLGG